MEQVTYYLLRLEQSPRFLRFISNRAKNFSWKYRRYLPQRYEINYLHEGAIRDISNGTTQLYRQDSVRCFPHNIKREWIAESEIIHEFLADFWLSGPPDILTEEEVSRWTADYHQAILPSVVTDHAVCQKIFSLLKSGIQLQNENAVSSKMQMQSCLYECFAVLTQYAVSRAKTRQQMLMKQRSSYTIRACAYIEAHLQERIRVEDVAAYAGVSYNHLKGLFRRDMDASILDYINRRKIRLVERYITADNMTMEQACQAVGLTEPKYLSRLFRQYTGISAREYRRIYSAHTEKSKNGE